MSEHTTIFSGPLPLAAAGQQQQPSSTRSVTEAPIQFETAQVTTPTLAGECTTCQKSVEQEYYELNGAPICARCSEDLRTHLARGSGVSGLARAVAAGTAAAIAGALLCFAITKLTGYEFGIIAILVGIGVGTAVRWGCYGRGGLLYQAIAVALTYLAIVGSYVPAIVTEIRAAQVRGAQSDPTAGQQLSTSAAPRTDVDDPPSLSDFVLALAFVLAIAGAAPFLAGFQNIIGIVIIGIGVYEAWKINKRPVFALTGPYAAGMRPPNPASVS